MSDNNGRPYNPHTPNFNDGGVAERIKAFNEWNRTFREEVALALMAGMYAKSGSPEDETIIAKWAIRGADALLAELAKGKT